MDTNGASLPDDQGVDLAQGQYHFYAIVVPQNNAGLLRTELQAISGNPNLYLRDGAAPTLYHYSRGSCPYYEEPELVDRQLSANEDTEYGDWVPLNGQTDTQLAPGLWVLAVQASGNSNARYRLQLSCGNVSSNGLVQSLPLDGSITYSNQFIAGGDWRYYQTVIPSNAPAKWVVTWTRQQGDAHLFIRDTAPPGDGAYDGEAYNYNSRPGDAMTWASDDKNEGPYPDFSSPGVDTLTTPPLRPGATYYLGFWSDDDAAFTVTCSTTGGALDVPVAAFEDGSIAGNISGNSSMSYRIDVPPGVPNITFNANNSANVVVSLEQGTIALPGGPAQWVSSGANSSLNQALTGVWPWLSGYSYYLTVTNTSSEPGTFSLVAPDLAPLSLASSSTAVSGNSLDIWYSVTNQGSGAATSRYGYWQDRVSLSTNATLAGAVTSWGWNYYGTLAAGTAYTVSNTVTLPALPLGTYYLILQADVYDYVPESNESNNTSMAISLAVVAPPVIITEPLSQSVPLGSPATLSVGVTGTPPISYQWLFEDNVLPGATNSTLIFNSIQSSNAGAYAVLVTNVYGSAQSSSAVVTVNKPGEYLLNPTADARIGTVLGTDGGSIYLSVYDNGGNIQRTVIQFDLSGLGTNQLITNAVLKLYADASLYPTGNPDGEVMEIYRITEPWTELQVAWYDRTSNDAWETPGGDYVGTTGVADISPYATNDTTIPGSYYSISPVELDWNVTSLVQDWYSGIHTNDGLLVLSYPGNGLVFHSRESGSSIPVLEVDTAVPGGTVITATETNGIVELNWPAITGRKYQLQYNDNLNPSNWNNLGDATTAHGSTGSAADPATNAQRFYRVVLLP